MKSNILAIPGIVAGENLSSNQYRAVRLNADTPGEVIAFTNANAPQLPIGIQQDNPKTAGQGVEVAGPYSVCKAEVGGTFDESVCLGLDNNGRVIEAPFEAPSDGTADLYIIATSLQAATVGAGEVVYVLVQTPVLASTEA